LNTVTDEPLRVLQFWRDLEIFNIPAPVGGWDRKGL